MRNVILLATITSLMVVCSQSPSPKARDLGLADTMMGKPVRFPSGLAAIANEKLYNPDSLLSNIGLTPFVVTIIDANCPKCIIFHLNAIDSLLSKNLPEYIKRVYVLNINPKAVRFFFRELYPEIRVRDGVLLADTCYLFEHTNRLRTAEPNLRVFMAIDGRIAAYGDPLYRSQSLDQYINALNYK